MKMRKENSMTIKEENEFVKNAVQALIDRGIAKPEYFTPSTVTDEELSDFEKEFNVTLPSLLKTFLKSYCYDFNYILGHVPEDICPETVKDEEYERRALWLDILSVPEENPLQNLYDRMKGFREVTTDEDLIGMPYEYISHFLSIGDWGAGWGPLCIDLSVAEDDISIDDMETWSLQWFDHEEFDWEEEYMNDSGQIKGEFAAPDFKSLLEWYFFGKFDKAYEIQENEKPDYSTYIDLN